MKVVISKKTGLFGHYLGLNVVFPYTMNEKYIMKQEGVPLNTLNWEIKEIELTIK